MDILFLSFGALISVINPLGTLPIFIGLMKDKTKPEMVQTALWTSINTLVILLIAFYFGKYLLGFFGISLASLKIAGGIIIASSGFALLSGNFTRHKGMRRKEKEDAQRRSDVSLTPLAIPMLAGPGSISLLITFYEENTVFTDRIYILMAIVLTTAVTFLLLLSSRVVVRFLGASGLNALSRIIGFIVISIGVEYVLSTFLLLFGK